MKSKYFTNSIIYLCIVFIRLKRVRATTVLVLQSNKYFVVLRHYFNVTKTFHVYMYTSELDFRMFDQHYSIHRLGGQPHFAFLWKFFVFWQVSIDISLTLHIYVVYHNSYNWFTLEYSPINGYNYIKL